MLLIDAYLATLGVLAACATVAAPVAAARWLATHTRPVWWVSARRSVRRYRRSRG